MAIVKCIKLPNLGSGDSCKCFSTITNPFPLLQTQPFPCATMPTTLTKT